MSRKYQEKIHKNLTKIVQTTKLGINKLKIYT